jgi:lipopolysaccharide/colanic/teichoic acid biosynthesis glycosyltransferase
MLIAAILIKLTSPGPVFYRSPRIGQFGHKFDFLKFRSMRVGDGGPSVTAEGDTRITAVGALIRRWKIDELPQFWNILVGDMSVIGPRPEVEKFVKLYTPEQRTILDARPGLASMAQLVYPHESEMLSGHPDPETAYAQQLLPKKLAVDLEYERQRSFVTDLRLIFEIVLLILGKRTRVDHAFHLEPPR